MRLGNYEWDPDADLIAAGAFAEVFRARDTNTAGRTVALKIYKEAVSKGSSGSSGQKKYTLEQEFHNVDGLSHTNIIAYYGLDYIHGQDAMGRQTSHPVLIMEYAEGGTLSDFLKTNPDKATIGRLIRDITLGVGYLHSEGILHRDLKPGNILITKDRRGEPVAKITDFGISRDTLTDKTLEQSFTEGVGTPHYMAPEQFFKKTYGLNGELSARTDIWALGVVVYRMLTGGLPFGEGERDLELVRDAVKGKDPDFDKVPARYRGLLEKCLAKHAADRVDSAAALLGLLNGGASVPPLPTPSPGPGKGSGGAENSPDELPTMPPAQDLYANPTPDRPAPGKKMGTSVLIGIVGLLLVVAAVMIYLSSRETKRFTVEETVTVSLPGLLPDSAARVDVDSAVVGGSVLEEAAPAITYNSAENETVTRKEVPRRQEEERPVTPDPRPQSDSRPASPTFPVSDQKHDEEPQLAEQKRQVNEPRRIEETGPIFGSDVVETMPAPVGGMGAWDKYLSSNLRYPSQARSTGVEGTVYVVFVVNSDGSIQDVGIIRGIGGGCDEEAIRLVQNTPNWEPGRRGGKPVRVKITLPVRFKLG